MDGIVSSQESYVEALTPNVINSLPSPSPQFPTRRHSCLQDRLHASREEIPLPSLQDWEKVNFSCLSILVCGIVMVV